MNNFTFWLVIGFWPIWIIWELVLLILRGHDPSVGLISMVARDRSYQMASLAFAWGSLAGHFWANWRDVPWDGWYFGVSFFLLILLVFIWDVSLWNTAYASLPYWVRVARFPGVMLFLGLLNGFLVFPQTAPKGTPF
jgi:hypothetical protein